MKPRSKLPIALGAGILVVVLIVSLGMKLVSDVSEPEDENAPPVDDQLWTMRNFDLLLLGVIIFATVVGVLALVGGDFKWS